MYKLLLFFPLFAPVQTYVKAIPHNSKCRYGERGAADAKPKAQIILDVLSSILATQMPCRSCRSGALPQGGVVWCCLNAFAAKSALSAFPFPGKIHPILPAFLITRTSSGTAQKPGDFSVCLRVRLSAFSSSGRTCLPSICRTQSSCKAFTPRIPTSASAPLWTCCCQKNSIHAILFQLRLLAQRLLFALTSKPQKDIYYISYKGKLSKKIAKEIQIGYNIK